MLSKNEPRRYAAFISYRHTDPDQKIAKILHFLLEHNVTRPGKGLPRKIRPVFLDTSELPTTEDLNQDIRDALDRSEHLYVICSPNLPLSKYCMEEIRYFKEKHGGAINRIHTLLVAGEPAEAFPEQLRTTVRAVELPDGTVRTETVEVEPLFADVRGKNLFHAVRKLLRTEYLRLAAAYYGCPYDKLYKRNLRWTLSVAAVIVAALLGGGLGLSAYRNTMTANQTASIAAEVMREDQQNLLGTLTLLHETEDLQSEAYDMVLRNAVVQYDYQKYGGTIGRTFLNTYQDTGTVIRYLSADGGQIIIQTSETNGSNRILYILDAHTGQIHLKEAQERVFVIGERPERYLVLRSHKNEAGVMMDYVSLMDMRDNSLISEFAFRESSRNSANYTLVSVIENPNLLTVKDGEAFVAYLTLDGIQLTEEEFVEIGLNSLDTPLPEIEEPYRLVRSRQRYLLKDAEDTVLLRLSMNDVAGYDFSGDWRFFAWIEDGRIHVFDLTERKEIASSRYTGDEQMKLMLLENGSYYAAITLYAGGETVTIYDWNTGKRLQTIQGVPLFSDAEAAIFAVQDGQVIRYDYRSHNLAAEGDVLTTWQNRCLTWSEDAVVRLIDTGDCDVLLEREIDSLEQLSWDRTLDHILLWCDGTVSCYNAFGKLLWEQSVESGRIAMSADGTLAAWAETDGDIVVADPDTGTETDVISGAEFAQAGELSGLAVGAAGIYAAGDRGSVFYAAENGSTFVTDPYSESVLTEDGLLILWDETARVRDFSVYDCAAEKVILMPDSNTGKWVYSEESGYLVRHIEESGNHSSMELEVLKRKKDDFTSVAILSLPSNYVERLHLDTTGQWLSVTSNGHTEVYNLKTMEKWLDAQCSLYYEGGSLYGYVAWGGEQYCFTPGDREALQSYVRDAVTDSWGVRTLTDEERKRYIVE